MDFAEFLSALGLSIPNAPEATRIIGRLVLAMLLGGLLGFERQRRGRAAGMRTYMLVALGAALFTLIIIEAGGNAADLSQVVKGVAAGVGFLGAGAILKRSEHDDIKGLTTAASIWLTAAAGLAVGAGWAWPAIVGVILSWAVLALSRVTDPEHESA